MNYFKFIILFNILFNFNELYPQWINIGGASGSHITKFVKDNYDKFYAKTIDGDTYRTINNGLNWERIQIENGKDIGLIGVGVDSIFSLNIDSARGELYYSIDAGLNWNILHQWTGEEPFLGAVSAFTFHNGYFFASRPSGIYRLNYGDSIWTKQSNGISGVRLDALQLYGTNSALYGLFPSGGGVFKTADGGQNWIPLKGGLTNSAVTSIFAEGKRLYLGTYGGIFLMIEGDSVWTNISNGLPSPMVGGASLYALADTVLAGTQGGIYRSADQGQNWVLITENLQNFGVYRTIIGVDNIVLAGSESGIFRSLTLGKTWTYASSGLSNDSYSINALTSLNGRLYSATSQGIYQLVDSVWNWQFSGTGITGEGLISSVISYNNIMFATAGVSYRSNLPGDVWEVVQTGIPASAQVNQVVAHSGVVFAATTNGVYRSFDAGDTWSETNGGQNFIPRNLFSNGSEIYMSCQFGSRPGTFYSFDNGSLWWDISEGLPNAVSEPVIALGYNSRNLYALTDWSVFTSNDTGTTWIPVNLPVPLNTRLNSILSVDGSMLIGSSEGLLISADNGDTWKIANEGLGESEKGISPRLVYQDKIFAVLGTNLFSRPRNELVSIHGEQKNSLSEVISIHAENIPNPFNSITQIQFNIHYQQPSDHSYGLRIQVINSQGQILQTIIDAACVPGRFVSGWQPADDLPSGIYFYKFELKDPVYQKLLAERTYRMVYIK